MGIAASVQAWRSRSERPWDWTGRAGLMFFCAALYLGLGLKYPNFLTPDNFFITLLSVTSIGVAAIGMTALLISGNVEDRQSPERDDSLVAALLPKPFSSQTLIKTIKQTLAAGAAQAGK